MKEEIKYIDIHSHLDFESYGDDRKNVINRMRENGVLTITIGTGLASSKEAVKIAEENENVWACIGAHPDDNSGEIFDEKEYEKLVKNPRVVAIGECGLDYFRLEEKFFKGETLNLQKGLSLGKFFLAEQSRQKVEFEKHILFAIKHKKPLMLHIRDAQKENKGLSLRRSEATGKGETLVFVTSAYDDAYEILKKYKGQTFGNLHFFTSNLKTAQKFIALGFTISFPGIITYVKDLDTVIKSVPLDKIHAETDSPFATPVPHRGERNEPPYVIEVYKKIAEIRGEDFEKVRSQILENSRKLFRIDI
jgi:TatD DNase family protein